MKRYKDSYAAIVIICGIIGVVGFFFFPVMQYRSGLAYEIAGSLLDETGNGNLRHVTMATFISQLSQAGSLKDVDYVVRFLGYRSAVSMLILYCIPLVVSIGYIVAGLMGKQAKVIMLALGISNTVCYIMQIVTFPKNMATTYEFSFWQYLLIASSVIVLLVGMMDTSSDSDWQEGDTSQEDVYSPISDPGNAGNGNGYAASGNKQGTLIGLSGEYKNAAIPLRSGEVIVIGRDASQCNLILQNPNVSRVHCYVQYNGLKEEYIIKDVSKYGVRDEMGHPIERNVEVHMRPGRRFTIGNGDDTFTLE